MQVIPGGLSERMEEETFWAGRSLVPLPLWHIDSCPPHHYRC